MTKLLPADIDPTSLAELIEDCRALADGAVHRVLDLTGSIPVQRTLNAPLEISERLRAMVEGYGA